MSDAIIPYTEVKSLSKDLSLSSLIPAALKKKPEDIAAILLTGREMGLGPMQSLRAFHIIQGAVTMKAETMTALVRASPRCSYLILKESTAKVATYETKRVGDPSPTTLSFTIEEAQQAGLLANPNFKKYPAAMLRARAGSGICKAVYSDLLLGAYDSESDELDVGPPVSESIPVSDLKAKLKAEIVDAELVSVEPEPVLSLSEQISAAQTTDDLRTLLDAIKASDDIEILKPMYFARLGVLKENA